MMLWVLPWRFMQLWDVEWLRPFIKKHYLLKWESEA